MALDCNATDSPFSFDRSELRRVVEIKMPLRATMSAMLVSRIEFLSYTKKEEHRPQGAPERSANQVFRGRCTAIQWCPEAM